MNYLIGFLFGMSLLAPAPSRADPALGPKMPDILAQTRFQEPPGFLWGQFINAKGQKIRWGALRPMDGAIKATIILGPGYSEFAEKYFELARDLTRKGFAIWIIDWPGQGGSARLSNDRQKMHGTNPADAVSDLDQFILQVVDRQGPLIALGHSWGANIMTRYLHDHPNQFRAAVFSSPTYWFAKKNGAPWLIKTLAYSAQMIGWGEDYALGQGKYDVNRTFDVSASTVSSDPQRYALTYAWYHAKPDLIIAGFSYDWVANYMRANDLIFSPGYLAAIKTPILMALGGKELYADNDAQREVCLKLAACRLIEFADGMHELLQERDLFRTPWLDSISAFIDQAEMATKP